MAEITSAWQTFTLANLPRYQWRGGSWVFRLLAFVSGWREGSWIISQWGETLGALLIAVVLALGPFVSTTLIGALLAAIGGYWMLVTLADEREGSWGATPIHYVLLLYVGIVALATAFSPVKMAALSGLIKLVLYLFFFVLAARVLRSPRLRSWAIAVFLLTALVVSVYGIRQELHGVEQLATWNDPTSELAGATRVYSYLGNPNLLAGYLLSAIAFSFAAFWVWRGWVPKILAGTMTLAHLACLYYTGSRGGWLAAIAMGFTFSLLLYFWWREKLPRFWQVWLLPIVFGGFTLFLAVAVASVEPLRLRVQSMFAGRDDSSINFRLKVFEAVFKMIRDRPLLGIGAGNSAFNQVYPFYMRPGYTALSAYSIFLETIVETGFIGLTVFLWLIVVTFNWGIRPLKQLRDSENLQGFWLMASIAAIAGLLVHGAVDTVWYRPPIQCLWWFVVAIVASFPLSKIGTNS
ncbi:IctB family putative bicarbonate transporter [Lusitaniella coriacea LEGE 07167]